jgi:hypothetical protein
MSNVKMRPFHRGYIFEGFQRDILANALPKKAAVYFA